MHRNSVSILLAVVAMTACVTTNNDSNVSRQEKVSRAAQMQADRFETQRYKHNNQQQTAELRRQVEALDAEAQNRTSGSPRGEQQGD